MGVKEEKLMCGSSGVLPGIIISSAAAFLHCYEKLFLEILDSQIFRLRIW